MRSVMPLAARLMMLPQNRTLDTSLSDDEMQVVTRAVIEAGLPEQMARVLRPWAATLFLASSECERLRFEAGLKPLDALVMETARGMGVSIVGLETILEQYEALASIPFDLQEVWLRSTIALHPHTDDMSETTVALYLSRQLEAVWPLTVELTKQSGMTDEFVAQLRREIVDNRNHRMALRAKPLIEKGGAFIAVGAMHLTGSEGLVALIVKDGLRVTPIL